MQWSVPPSAIWRASGPVPGPAELSSGGRERPRSSTSRSSLYRTLEGQPDVGPSPAARSSDKRMGSLLPATAMARPSHRDARRSGRVAPMTISELSGDGRGTAQGKPHGGPALSFGGIGGNGQIDPSLHPTQTSWSSTSSTLHMTPCSVRPRLSTSIRGLQGTPARSNRAPYPHHNIPALLAAPQSEPFELHSLRRLHLRQRRGHMPLASCAGEGRSGIPARGRTFPAGPGTTLAGGRLLPGGQSAILLPKAFLSGRLPWTTSSTSRTSIRSGSWPTHAVGRSCAV